MAEVVSPLFSVVIPAYNAGKFIAEALDSVVSQTFSKYEVIVVDDGSMDSTSSQVKKWAVSHPGCRLTLLRQGNLGIGAARNAGVEKARGEYLAFLDADDLWSKQKLEAVARCLQCLPNVDLICHDEWIEVRGREKGRLRHGPYTTYADLLFKGNCLSTSATVVRCASVLQVGGFPTELKFNGFEDYDLWLRLAKSGCRFAYIHEILGTYRVTGQGVTSKIEEHCAHGLNVLNSHFEDWPRKMFYSRYCLRRRRGAILRGAAHSFMRCGKHEEARQYLYRALSEDPLSWKTWGLSLLNLPRVQV